MVFDRAKYFYLNLLKKPKKIKEFKMSQKQSKYF